MFIMFINYLTSFTVILFILKETIGGPPKRIVGGTHADIKDYPFMVAFENGYTWQTCGAMLITSRHVMTAAHCIVRGRKDNDPYRYELRWYNIVSGDSNRENVETVQVHQVARIDVHGSFIGYPPPDVGDIAILTLTEDIEVGPRRRPANLPSRRYGRNEHGVILGWGWTKPENSASVKHLKKAPMTIEGAIPGDKFAAVERDGIAFCNGDSGGPFYINGEVIGIISYSPDCTGRTAGVFTEVYQYLPWIKDVIRGRYSPETARHISVR